ncbi:MAG: CRISPR-associated endonuclease Cas2 [Bacteroidota bacterium]
MSTLTFVLVHRIPPAKRRTVRRLLLRFGERVQPGVYQCRLTPKQARRLRLRLDALYPSITPGVIHLIPACAACVKQVQANGKPAFTAEPTYYFVG